MHSVNENIVLIFIQRKLKAKLPYFNFVNVMLDK